MKPRTDQLAQTGATPGQVIQWDGTAWSPANLVARSSMVFSAPGAAVVQAGKSRFYCPAGLTDPAVLIYALRASAGTPPTGTNIRVQLMRNGSSIEATLDIPVGANTSGRNAVAILWPVNDFFTVDITQVGSTTSGADVTLQMEYQQ